MLVKKWKDLSSTAQMFFIIGSICAGAFTIGGAAANLSHMPEDVKANTERIIALEDRMGLTERKIDRMICLQIASMEDTPYERCL